ncbi:SCO6880 family protein [Streptomyces sp. MS19]|uniref:SCO6880 family protein n=1 Tax=Streptomyces sp. MS19 TaxID=3385972 RepID=UPI0039A0A4EA
MPEKPVLAPPTVVFPHRSRRGILYGLSLPQLLLVSGALALLLVAVLTTGLPGAMALSPVWAATVVLVTVRRSGRSLIDWAPLAARYAVRRRTGQDRWLARPLSRPRLDGLLHLPGTAASLRVLSPGGPDGQAAALHDPHQQTLTAVARVTSRGYALLDPATQHAHVAGWGRALAATARASSRVTAVQVLERTVPDATGDAVARHWASHGLPDSPTAGIYADLVAAAGPAAAPHETYLAVGIDLKAAKRRIRQAGGADGAFALLRQSTSAITQSAHEAGLTVTGWLTASEIAGVIRTAYDPASHATLQQQSANSNAVTAPSAAGPVTVIEEGDRLATDTARHAVFWVENWPRTETNAAFLHALMFTGGVRRSLSLIYTPQDLEAAFRDVRRAKAGALADATERARRGQVAAEADTIEYQDAVSRERQLIAGHGSVALTGLLTVSATSDTELDAACTQIQTAAVTAQIDLRRLTYQQGEAFVAAALPLARTVL